MSGLQRWEHLEGRSAPGCLSSSQVPWIPVGGRGVLGHRAKGGVAAGRDGRWPCCPVPSCWGGVSPPDRGARASLFISSCAPRISKGFSDKEHTSPGVVLCQQWRASRVTLTARTPRVARDLLPGRGHHFRLLIQRLSLTLRPLGDSVPSREGRTNVLFSVLVAEGLLHFPPTSHTDRCLRQAS